MLSMQNQKLLYELQNNKYVLRMKNFKQHGFVNTYQHCCNVTTTAILIADKLKLSDHKIQNIIVGAMLHDFYLYDYHGKRMRKHGLHAVSHPFIAIIKANRYFDLTKKQKNIIKAHMFPSTIFFMPKSIEAWIVNASDKYCALHELMYSTFYHKVWVVKFV